MFPSFCSAPGFAGLWGECAVGYDFFAYQVDVREITGIPGNTFPTIFTSSGINTSGPSSFDPTATEFDIPLGVLAAGRNYAIGIRLNHNELEEITQPFPNARFFSPLENRSTAFVEFTTSIPIPEPETYAMLVAGLGLLGFAIRRKSRALDSKAAA